MNKKLEHYVRRYGWWQMGIIAVVLIITAAVLVDVSRGSDDAGSREHARSAAGSGGHDGHGGHEDSAASAGPARRLATVQKRLFVTPSK